MKHNNDKKKEKFQSFVNLIKKVNVFFWGGFTFNIEVLYYISYYVQTLIMFKHVKSWKVK